MTAPLYFLLYQYIGEIMDDNKKEMLFEILFKIVKAIVVAVAVYAVLGFMK